MSRRAVSRPMPTLAPARPSGERVIRAHFPSTAELPAKPLYEVVTRVYNFLGALVGILLLSPLLIGIAVAVKVTSPGPALYRGARVGRHEQTFHIFKFRTMHTGAEQKIGKRLVQQTENHFTPIGKFLRRYRLDELAQLFNVLKGDMNLVGPRPIRPIFLEDHKKTVPGYAKRFFVRPGITGKAQVRGGYYTSPRHKLFYEVIYIRNRGVWMDLNLIVLTFLRVMNRIFTTGFLLAWLLLLALVLPSDIQAEFTVRVGTMPLNLMYILPPLIAAWHVFGREVTDQRLYALRTPVDTALLGFLAVTLFIVPFSRVPLEALKGLGWYVCNGVVIFYIVLNSRLVTERRTTLINTLVFGAALAGLLSADVLWGHLQNAGHSDIPLGTGGVAVVLSALGIVTTPLAVARFEQAQRPWRRVAYLLAAVVVAGTTLMAWRRSGLLFLALALFLYFWRERRRLAVLVGLVYTGTLAALLATGTAGYRPATIAADLTADVDRQVTVLGHVQPLRLAVGVGARALPAHAQKDQNVRSAARKDRDRNERVPRVPSPNNTWLTLLAEHGIVGFAFFAAFMLRGLGLMWRATGRIADTSARKDLWATVAGLIGFAGLMCTADLFYRLPMLLIFWCAMGLGIGTALMYQPGPRTYYRLVHYRHKL